MDCPICGYALADVANAAPDVEHLTCQRCGVYDVTGTALAVIPGVPEPQRMMLSGEARRAHEVGMHLMIDDALVQRVARKDVRRRSLFANVDRFLLYLADRLERPFKPTPYYTVLDFTLLGFTSEEGMKDVAVAASKLGYLSPNSPVVTLEGLKRIEVLRSTRPDSRKAFVAMWFDDRLDEAWAEGFKKGVEDTGYFEAVRMKELEHAGKIDDRIIAEIRTSGLLVADFTGQRGGVYFESGFATGLGIPVIWTCRKDHMKKLHFDTRQYNHIGWSEPSDLREKLRTRILAVVPAVTAARRD